MLLKLIGLFFLLGLTGSIPYRGYKVYEMIPLNNIESNFLHELSHKEGYDSLHISKVPRTAARFMVAPAQQNDFERKLKARSIKYQVIVNDVGIKLKEDGINKQMSRKLSEKMSFTKYYRHADINAYLDELAQANPRYVTINTIGKSYEGRALKTIAITNGNRIQKRVILIDAGIHAREWAAPATATFFAHKLVEEAAAGGILVEKFDWIILPVVNPDGYEYTHSKERMWRKTRSPNGKCFGTDGNRNFDYHWAEIGASNDPCSETYRGPKAFSELETRALRDLMLALKGRLTMYLTLHSYGNYLLYPWGWTDELPKQWELLDEVSKVAAEAMTESYGDEWTVGSSTNVLYAAAGGSDDYAYAKAGATVSITMELPAKDSANGFDPKPDEIESIVSEAWVGLQAMASLVDEKYSRSNTVHIFYFHYLIWMFAINKVFI